MQKEREEAKKGEEGKETQKIKRLREERQYKVKIDEDMMVRLEIDKENLVGIIYFTSIQTGKKVDIPEEIILYDITYNSIQEPNKGLQAYLFNLYSHYRIYYKQNIVFKYRQNKNGQKQLEIPLEKATGWVELG